MQVLSLPLAALSDLFHVFLFLTSSSVSRFPGPSYFYAVGMIALVNRFTNLGDIHHRRSLRSRRF